MYYVGIDLGGTKIAAGLVDEDGKLIHKDSVPTHRERTADEIIKDMSMLSLKVVKDAGVDLHNVKAIGIGAPGTPNTKEGTIVYANNLNFRNVPVRSEMQKYINLPVYVENDANCAALAESVAGAAKGTEHSVTITLGTGVGGGVVINGKVYSGFNNAGAELGHILLISDGEPCTCGRRGCWESYASATACINQTRAAALKNPYSLINKLIGGDLSKIDAKTAFDAAKQGDAVALEVVRQYIWYVAEGITDVINSFMPEVLVIGGGVSKEGEYLLEPLRHIVFNSIYSREDVPRTRIVAAEMGNDAGIIGAAMLGR